MRKLLAIVALSLSPALACTPAQSARGAQDAARATIRQRLGVAAFMYQFTYSDVSHSVQLTPPTIKGNVATVRGNLTIRATEKKTGKPVVGQYKGTVTLGKVGSCGWRVTGYQQQG